jgi:glycosyltransferase involved in cell wall biosynthesis
LGKILVKKFKIFHVIKDYKGNNPLQNSMILGLDDRFDARACYIYGSPDGRNILDHYGKAIYLDIGAGKSKLSVICRLTRFLKSERPVMLHCHKHKATVFGTLAAIFSGIPYVISHVHGLDRTRTLRTRLINWLLLKRVELIIGISEGVRKDILKTNWGLSPEKVVAVWNGIDIIPIDALSQNRKLARIKLGIPEGDFVFGTVGRLVKTKGHKYLLKSFPAIRREYPDSKVVIIGDGPLRGDLEKLARDLGITQNVVFAGFRSDVLELLPGFDAFVLPSVAEGLSLALLEAMASKLPVIASEVGGVPEVFGNEDIGRLVPAKDPHALAKAMKEIASLSPEERKASGNAARKRIEEAFIAKIMVDRMKGVYESILTS